jgi:hypothetical protein
MILSIYFSIFMNDALEHYKDELIKTNKNYKSHMSDEKVIPNHAFYLNTHVG